MIRPDRAVRSRARRGGALLAALAALAAPAACAPVDTVVADVPADAGDGRCARDADCAADTFCAKDTCGDRTGTCQRRPLVCPNDTQPVCGCDGVSYWNDCLRKQNGAAASTPGECLERVARCGGPRRERCALEGAACAQLVERREACDVAAEGVCWVLPERCPDEGAGVAGRERRFTPCEGAARCEGTCGAIRAGRAYRAEERACPRPP